MSILIIIDWQLLLSWPSLLKVIISLSHTQWLISQLNSVLSVEEIVWESIQWPYTFNLSYALLVSVCEMIKQDFVQQMSLKTINILDELDHKLKKYWDTDTENWKKVNMCEMMWDIIRNVFNNSLIKRTINKALLWCLWW